MEVGLYNLLRDRRIRKLFTRGEQIVLLVFRNSHSDNSADASDEGNLFIMFWTEGCWRYEKWIYNFGT